MNRRHLLIVSAATALLLLADGGIVPGGSLARASERERQAVPPIVSPPTVAEPETVKGDFRARPAGGSGQQQRGFVEGESEEAALERGASTKLFDNPDGTRTARLYSAPVHYEDAEGAWREIDTRIVPAPGGFRNAGGRADIRFAESASSQELVKVAEGPRSVSFSLEGAAGSAAEAGGQTVRYPGVAPGVDLEYRVGRSHVKEVLVLEGPPGGEAAPAYRFPLRLGALTPRAIEGGGVGLFDLQGRMTMSFSAPVAYDSAPGSEPDSAPATLRLTGEQGSWVLLLEVDPAWLSDPARVFPVYLDPTLNFDFGTGNTGGGSDAFVGEGAPNTNFNVVCCYNLGGVDYYTDRIGYRDLTNGTNGLYWTFLSFDFTAIKQHPVLDADFNAYFVYSSSSSPTTYRLRRATGAWSASTLTWNNMPGYGAEYVDETAVAGAWDSADLTTFVTNWATGAWPNQGILVSTGHATDSTRYKAFASDENTNGKAPYIDVLLDNRAPGAPSPASPSPEAVTDTITPTLSAGSVADPDGDSVLYQFRVATDPDGQSGRIVDSGWIPSPSWTAPRGSLTNGGEYYWTVQARDEYWSYSAWSTPRLLDVDLGLGEEETRGYDSVGAVTVNLTNGGASMGLSSPSFPTLGGGIGLTYSYNSRAPSTQGLTAHYYNDDGDRVFEDADPLALTRIDPQLNFKWGTSSPYPAVTKDDFLVRWEGYVTVPDAGTYFFDARHDNGAKIWVDDLTTPVKSSWVTAPASDPTFNTTGRTLAEGQRVAIKAEMFERTGGAEFTLWVKGPFGQGGAITEAPVPASWLTTEANPLPDGWSVSADLGGSLSYVSAEILDGSVVLNDASGAAHPFRWTGDAWRGEDGHEQEVLANDAATGLLTLHGEDGMTYSFNAEGELVSASTAIDDRSTAAPAYNYSGSPPRLTRITDPVSGRFITLTYQNAAGNACPSLAGFTAAPTGSLCKVDYSQFSSGETRLYYSGGHLARIEDPGAEIADFGYDSLGLLSQLRDSLTNDLIAYGAMTDPASDSHKTLVAYDSAGRVASVTLPIPEASATERPAHTYVYVPGATEVEVAGLSPASGYASKVFYDEKGRVTESRDMSGAATTYVYDSVDRLISTTDPLGRKSTTIYDDQGRPTDAYGPGAAAEFDTGGRSATAPHSSTAYDEGISGLQAAWWDTGELAGAPGQHSTMTGWQDWGSGAPASAIGPDTFSARLTGEIDLPSAGAYGFTASVGSDESVALYLDEEEVIDRSDPYREAVLEGAPSAYWRLGESSGAVAQDQSPNDRDGAYSGGAALGRTGAVLSDPDTAALFDGADDRVTGAFTRPANNFSVEAWVKPTTTHQIDAESTSGAGGAAGQRYLYAPDHFGSNAGMGVSVGTNGISVYEHGDSYMPATAVYSGALSGWNHVAIVYEAKVPHIYLNGELVREGLTSPKLAVYAPLVAGYHAYGAFPGEADEVAFYPRSMTAAEVSRHYDAGVATFTGTSEPVAAGSHRVRIDYQEATGPAKLSLAWTPPGGTPATVPVSALAPAYGLATTETDPDGKAIRTDYAAPALSLPTASVADPSGLALRSTTTYEAEGTGYLRRLSRTLPKGAATTVSYSWFGATETADNPCTAAAESINQAGMLRSTTSADPDGAGPKAAIVEEQVYDEAASVAAARIAGDESWACTFYDSRGRVTRRLDRLGGETTYDYSNPAAVTASFPDSSGAPRTTASEADWLGRALRYTDEHGTVHRTAYDGTGRPAATYRRFTGGAEALLTTVGYDSSTGRVASVAEYASGSERTSTFEYDDAGSLLSVTRPNGVVTTNSYDASRGWLDSISNMRGQTELSPWSYQRSGSGNLTREETAGRVRLFTYDPAGRLTSTDENGTVRRYAYDLNTNRCANAASCDGSFTYDAADRITSSPYATSYSYDHRGNMTSAAMTAQPPPASIGESFEFSTTGGPKSFPIVIGQEGSLQVTLGWEGMEIFEEESYSASIPASGTYSKPVAVHTESYVASSLTWEKGTHDVSSVFTGTVANSFRTHPISVTGAGAISASFDWSTATKTESQSGTVTTFQDATRAITTSAPGTIRATVTWPNQTINPNLDLFIKDASGTIIGSSTALTGNSETAEAQVTSLSYPSTRGYTVVVDSVAGDTSYNLTVTYPVTAEVDLELLNPAGTKVAEAVSTTLKPDSLNYAVSSGATGTYTLKVISRNHSAPYTLSATYPQTAWADLTLNLKDPQEVVKTARSATGSLSLGYLAPAAGDYELQIVNNSGDLAAPSVDLLRSVTTVGTDSFTGSLGASPASAVRTVAADGEGHLTTDLTWEKGTHNVSSVFTGTVANSSRTHTIPVTGAGTVQASVNWGTASASLSLSDHIAFETGEMDEHPITPNASGQIQATLTWPSTVRACDLCAPTPNPADLYLGLLVVNPNGSRTTVTYSQTFPGYSESVTYNVTNLAYPGSRQYILQVAPTGTGSTDYTLTSTYPVTAEVDLELLQAGGTKVAEAVSTTNKPDSLSYAVSSQNTGTYTLKVISRNHSAPYTLSATYPQVAWADISFDLKQAGSTLSSSRSATGALSIAELLPGAGSYSLEVKNNSPDLSVPSFTLSTKYPKTAYAKANLLLKDSGGNTVASDTTAARPKTIAAEVDAGPYTLEVAPVSGYASAATLEGEHPSRPLKQQIEYDAWDHATTIDDGSKTVTETLSPSGRVLRRVVSDSVTAEVSDDVIFGYESSGDSPSYSRPTAGGAVTTYLGLVIDKGGTPSYPIQNGHGDIVGTTDAAGVFTANPVTDEWGAGESPEDRLGYLGGHQRFVASPALGLIRMGVRLYDPALGRFLQIDPVEGGSANDYDYVAGDSINKLGLDGRCRVQMKATIGFGTPFKTELLLGPCVSGSASRGRYRFRRPRVVVTRYFGWVDMSYGEGVVWQLRARQYGYAGAHWIDSCSRGWLVRRHYYNTPVRREVLWYWWWNFVWSGPLHKRWRDGH